MRAALHVNLTPAGGSWEGLAIEIKRGLAPQLDPSFHLACDAVRPERRLVVYGGVERYPLGQGVEAVSLVELCEQVSAA